MNTETTETAELTKILTIDNVFKVQLVSWLVRIACTALSDFSLVSVEAKRLRPNQTSVSQLCICIPLRKSHKALSSPEREAAKEAKTFFWFRPSGVYRRARDIIIRRCQKVKRICKRDELNGRSRERGTERIAVHFVSAHLPSTTYIFLLLLRHLLFSLFAKSARVCSLRERRAVYDIFFIFFFFFVRPLMVALTTRYAPEGGRSKNSRFNGGAMETGRREQRRPEKWNGEVATMERALEQSSSK